MEPKYIIALEIGSSKIRGAAGTVDDAGMLTVVAVEEEKLIDCVRYGCIRNVEEVSNRINRIIKKLEDRLRPRKVKSVYVALGGMTFSSTPRDVTRRLPEEAEVTEALMSDLRTQAFALPVGGRDIADVLERRVFIDRNLVPHPIGTYGQDVKAEYNLITSSSKIKQMIQRAVNERLQLDVAGYIVRQIAEADLVLTSDEKKLGCVLVDFGAETTGVSIYKNGSLNYFATLPLGSRNITLDIGNALNLLEEHAEDYKKIGGNASAERQSQRMSNDGVNYDDINNYVSARSGEIIANINEQIKYADLTPAQLPAGIIVVGGGAKLNGFIERLEQETKMPVRKGTPKGYVRLNDAGISNDDIDVISVLYAAARQGATECMDKPVEQATPQVTNHAPQHVEQTQQYTQQTSQQTEQHTQSQPVREIPEDDYAPEPQPRVKEPKRGKSWWGKIKDVGAKFINDEPDEDWD